MSPLKADIEGAARILVGAGTTIALTGAGISVPSGIPDFRSESGLWSRFDIHEYGTLDAFRANPRKVWRLFHEIAATMDGAEPNPAHEALVRLEQMGLLAATVTQNIDGLHRKAGARNLIEFHGSAETLSCLKCGSSWPRAEAEGMLDEARIPVCRCGTVLKPDIILFGESIPVHALRDSFELASRADAILVVGTSAEVAPASLLPAEVARSGGRIVEMDRGRTSLRPLPDIRITGDVAETLPLLVAEIERIRNR